MCTKKSIHYIVLISNDHLRHSRLVQVEQGNPSFLLTAVEKGQKRTFRLATSIQCPPCDPSVFCLPSQHKCGIIFLSKKVIRKGMIPKKPHPSHTSSTNEYVCYDDFFQASELPTLILLLVQLQHHAYKNIQMNTDKISKLLFIQFAPLRNQQRIFSTCLNIIICEFEVLYEMKRDLLGCIVSYTKNEGLNDIKSLF